MNANSKHWKYQFTSKSGNRIYFNEKTKEWATEMDYAQLVEPNLQETVEILEYIVNTAMDYWKDTPRKEEK